MKGKQVTQNYPVTGQLVTEMKAWLLDQDPMARLITEMRAWLLDCGCDSELLARQTDDEVMREVERQYEGGLEAFMREMM